MIYCFRTLKKECACNLKNEHITSKKHENTVPLSENIKEVEDLLVRLPLYKWQSALQRSCGCSGDMWPFHLEFVPVPCWRTRHPWRGGGSARPPACLSLPPLSSVPCGDPDVAGRVIHAHTLRKVPIWPCTSTLSPGSAHTQSMGGRETTMILVGIQWHLLTSVRWLSDASLHIQQDIHIHMCIIAFKIRLYMAKNMQTSP